MVRAFNRGDQSNGDNGMMKKSMGLEIKNVILSAYIKI